MTRVFEFMCVGGTVNRIEGDFTEWRCYDDRTLEFNETTFVVEKSAADKLAEAVHNFLYTNMPSKELIPLAEAALKEYRGEVTGSQSDPNK